MNARTRSSAPPNVWEVGRLRAKILSVIVSLAMVFSMVPMSAIAAQNQSSSMFSDVSATDWFYDSVEYVTDKGLMVGTGNNQFSPNDVTSRGMVVTVLWRLEGEPSADGASFSDVSNDLWYTNAVAWAAANGIVTGYGNGTFGPDDPITREQMATIVYRYSSFKNYDVSSKADLSEYPDAAQISSYATEAMAWANAAKLITGVNGKTLEPQGSALRSQAAAILMRFCQNVVEANQTFTLTYELNYDGAGTYRSITVKNGEVISAPASPVRVGFTFDGWYTAATGGSAFNFKSGITADTTLYAHWKILGTNISSGSSTSSSTSSGTSGGATTGTTNPSTNPGSTSGGESSDGMIDEDNDGVELWLEEYFGLSDANNDTDGDGIDDYTEIYVLSSNPAVADSDQDTDGDGLSDYDEVVTYGTDPTMADTDSDDLSDYEEIFQYKTDPLKEDTDGDGIYDGYEVYLGLDPLKKSSLSGIVQTLSNDCISDNLLEENDAIPSVVGKSDFVLNRSVSLSESDNAALEDNRAIIGKGVELETFEEAELTIMFTLSSMTSTVSVMKLDETEGWIPLESKRDGNTLSADVNQSGTYCVMDIEELLSLLGVSIDSYLSKIDSDYSVASLSSGDADLGSGSDASLSTLVLDSAMGQADIVFVVDTTGSMTGEINNVVNNIAEFAQTLVGTYNINVNYALVDYRDITVDGADSTKIVKNGTSNWYSKVSDFKTAIMGLSVDGGGDEPETVVDALDVARNLNYRSSAEKFIVLVTDASYKVDNNYGIESMSEEVGLLKDAGIITSVVSLESYRNTIYQSLYTDTNGIFANIYGNFSSELLLLATKIGAVVNDGNWILLDDYQYVKLDKALSPDSGDTDGDFNSDYSELKAPKQKEITNLVKQTLIAKGVSQEMVDKYFRSEDGVYITVYPYVSNPCLVDTDFDGMWDNDDPHPRDSKIDGTLKTNYSNSDISEFTMDYRWFFADNTVYNKTLSTVSLLLSSVIYSGNSLSLLDVDGCTKTAGKSMEDVMSYFGLRESKTYSLDKYYTDDHISEVGLGYCPVIYNGSTKYILAVVVRGTNGSIKEWSSNFYIGDSSEFNSLSDWKTINNHAGFDIVANRIMGIVEQYIVEKNLEDNDIVYWVTGHSRGASVANIIGAYYEDEGRESFTYTFASPNTTLSANASSYESIFNIVNSDDFAPCLPMTGWGYSRYGKTVSTSISSSYKKEWNSLTGLKYNCASGINFDYAVSALTNILSGDARNECYKYTCNCSHGDNSSNNISIINYGLSEESRDAAIAKIPTNALPYCIITTIGWNFKVCQTPSYFMQILAAKMSKNIDNKRFAVELNIADRYEKAKSAIVAVSLGGVDNPHYTESYYVLTQHVRASQF